MKTTRSYQFKVLFEVVPASLPTTHPEVLYWASATSRAEALASLAIRLANTEPNAEVKSITFVG